MAWRLSVSLVEAIADLMRSGKSYFYANAE